MSINWPQLDGDITRLYMSEGKSIEDTLQYLHSKYKVNITPRQFKRKYSGLKKLRAIEWKVITREIAQRETENKRSEVFLNGRKLDSARIEREKRRYGNSCEVVEGRANIDLGIDTIGKHRLEIRTLQPPTTGVPFPEPHLVWPFEPRAGNLEQTDAVNQLEPNLRDVFEYDLELADLNTPRWELNSTISLPRAASQAKADHQTLIRSGHSAFSLQSGTIAALGDGSAQNTAFQRLRRTPSEFGLSSPRPSGYALQCGFTHQCTDIPLSFFVSSDAINIIANLQSSRILASADLETIYERITPRLGEFDRPKKYCNQISSYFASIGSSPRIPPQVLLLTDGILSNWDIPSLSKNREINFLVQSHGRQLLHLLFSLVAHLCCNNLMVNSGLFSFIDWLSEMEFLNQFGIFLRGNPTAAHAIIEELVRELHNHPGRENPFRRDNFTAESDLEDRLAMLLEFKNLHLPKRITGSLLHAIAFMPWIKLGKILVALGADLNFEKPLKVVSSTRWFKGSRSCAGTPLCQAVVDKQLKMVEFLITAGCDVKREFHDELTGKSYNALGLCLSDYYPDMTIAELLLSAGCEFSLGFNLNCQQAWKKLEHYEEIPQQLQEKLNVSLQFRTHQKLCEGAVKAAASGSQELSTYLLEHEVFEEEALEYILRVSVEEGNGAAVGILLRRGVNPNATKQLLGNRILGGDEDLEASTPINVAASLGEYTIVYMLYKAGAKFEFETWEEVKRNIGYPAVVEKPCLDLLSALMVSGVDPALIGPSALEMAAANRSVPTCGFLLDLGAPIDAYGAGGQTALQRAASKGELEILLFLLSQGADVNVPAYRDNGRTALQAAAKYLNDSDDILENLLNAGADVRAPPAAEGGLTVLEAIANTYFYGRFREFRMEKQLFWFKRFLSLGAPINRPNGASSNILHGLIRSQNHKCLEFALQTGARVEDRNLEECEKEEKQRGDRHMTPLQYAAMRVDQKAIHILLEHGANVNAVAGENFGRSALQAVASSAPSKSVTEAVDLLLSNGADVNAAPAQKGGITALQGAASRGNFGIVKTLLAHGAGVNAPGAAEEGRTALEISAEWGRFDMVRFLLSEGAAPDPVRGCAFAIKLAETNGSFVVAEFLRNYETMWNPLSPGLGNMNFGDDFPVMGFNFPDSVIEELMGHF